MSFNSSFNTLNFKELKVNVDFDIIDRDSLSDSSSIICDEILSDDSECEYSIDVNEAIRRGNTPRTNKISEMINDNDMFEARTLLNKLLGDEDIEPSHSDLSIQNAELAYELAIMRERETVLINSIRSQVVATKRLLSDLISELHKVESLKSKRARKN